jgi:predicted phosphodiesterase
LTVRHVTTDQATLFFELDDQAAGYLFYQALQPPSPELAETQAIPLTPGETRQQITLEGLTPGAEYLAAAGLTDAEGVYRQPVYLGQAWGSVRFRTLSNSEPLRFGVIGDASFGDPASVALVERLATYDLDFVIHTGDVVAETYENNSLAEAYALKFYQTLSPLLHNLPVYTVPGNHDQDAAVRWQDSFYYYYAFPPFPDPRFRYPALRSKNQYYAIAYKDVQFLMLDSQVMFGAEGWEEQESWLTERLADPQYRYSIPIFHVPPFFSSSVHPDDQLPVRQFWHPLFAGDHVPLAFSGHSHHYERLLADGITYIVTGGGSGTLYAVGKILPESQIYVARTHFVLAELYTDHIELTAIDKDGTVLDQAIIPLQE